MIHPMVDCKSGHEFFLFLHLCLYNVMLQIALIKVVVSLSTL